ncbi:hypothetical protein D3273_25165 [Lichenibacterium minor]|uniref:Transcriptional regulator n=1 Tax=Lichenibacterium minor TaxID=2316528 RepID=A0A4Q2U2U7_9HYPH|nr:hypothetical protein [Lichenibacterium minor]RYC29211.1 hypothetical protein D3273_25165 [Lichenibacterium minor]
MLTGRQIREARTLLSLSPSGLAVKVRVVTTDTVKRAEADAMPPIADSHRKAIQRKLEELGIEFTPDGPKLRKVEI